MHATTSEQGTASRPVRVVVADDSAAMREAVADVLRESGALDVVAVLPDGLDIVGTVARTQADLVLIDVVMPGGGAQAARALLADAAGPGDGPVVVAVSANADPGTVLELVRAGATGYLVKGRLGDGFVDDVLRCAQGEVVLAVPHGARVLRDAVGGGAGGAAGAPDRRPAGPAPG